MTTMTGFNPSSGPAAEPMTSGEARQQIALLKAKLAHMEEAAKAQASVAQVSGAAAAAMQEAMAILKQVSPDTDEASAATARATVLERVLFAFNELDLDGNGEIDRGEVEQLASQGEGLADAKIDELFATFDTDGDGLIQKSEWLTFYGSLFDAAIGKGPAE